MELNSIDLCQKEGLEECTIFFKKNKIKYSFPIQEEGKFNRDLSFFVNRKEYIITWYINECTLWLDGKNTGAFIKFKYIFLDLTYPLIGGNRSIAFSYRKNKKESIFDNEFPYDVLRIIVNR